MTTNTVRTPLPAILGFAFVAVAFGETFWVALLCLLGAAVFHLAYKLWRGEMTLTELRERVEAARSGFANVDRR